MRVLADHSLREYQVLLYSQTLYKLFYVNQGKERTPRTVISPPGAHFPITLKALGGLQSYRGPPLGGGGSPTFCSCWPSLGIRLIDAHDAQDIIWCIKQVTLRWYNGNYT